MFVLQLLMHSRAAWPHETRSIDEKHIEGKRMSGEKQEIVADA
jgi:hypothetical protein